MHVHRNEPVKSIIMIEHVYIISDQNEVSRVHCSCIVYTQYIIIIMLICYSSIFIIIMTVHVLTMIPTKEIKNAASKIKFPCVELMHDRRVKFGMYLSSPLLWIVCKFH